LSDWGFLFVEDVKRKEVKAMSTDDSDGSSSDGPHLAEDRFLTDTGTYPSSLLLEEFQHL
jgi:hypothetical protein